MKILFLCGRETDYPFNRFMIECFEQFSSVDIILEKGSGKSILRRSMQVFLASLTKVSLKRYDLIYVGFFGQFLMLTSGLIARRPILFNPFISTYDTLVFDRQRFSNHSILARLVFLIDKTSCNRAAHLVLDTQAHIDYFVRIFDLPKERFNRIFLSNDDRVFYPRPHHSTGKVVNVLFHGSYLPLQGIDTIIQAANILKKQSHIRFLMVGRGPGYKRIFQNVQNLNLTNIEFGDSVPPDQLPEIIAKADICLGGHFGSSDKAARVIAGKTFQDIAMGKPTIVGDNLANHELLTHGYDAWFIPPDDPSALALGIETLAKDPALRVSIGRQAHQTFMEKASLKVLVPELKIIVERMVGTENPEVQPPYDPPPFPR